MHTPPINSPVRNTLVASLLACACVQAQAYYSLSHIQGTLSDLSPDQIGQGQTGKVFSTGVQYGAPNVSQTWNSRGSNDPMVSALTVHGKYEFGYNGSANVSANSSLHAKLESSSTDIQGTSGTQIYGNVAASWEDVWYIPPTPDHKAGSQGFVKLHMSLDGALNVASTANSLVPFNNYVSLTAFNRRFVDGAVTYDSVGGLYLNGKDAITFSGAGGANYMQWALDRKTVASFNNGLGNASTTVLMPFRYGESFNIGLTLNLLGWGNSSLDFSHTGKVTQVDVPIGTKLTMNMTSSGVVPGFAVIESADPLLTPVPEPSSVVFMMLGLTYLGLRRQRATAATSTN